jgi:pimeloyl-ACP methyl ester carboxylesterase
MRQAVLDGRQLVAVLKEHGYGKVSVLGMSLGSWVAGLVAAHDRAVERAALFLTAGSLADMVWTGRATRHIRKSLEGKIERADLRRAWGPLDLGLHADKLAREDLDLLIVLAERDTVVLPDLSEDLVAKLNAAGARPEVMRLNCGHYSLSLPPYILRAGFGVSQLLKRGP